MSALSTGTTPAILPSEEMEVMLAKFKTYGKQPSQLTALSDFERRHAISAPPRLEATAGGAGGGGPGCDAPLPFLEQRNKVIETCLAMNRMGINQGTSGNASCRVEGGFLVTASGVPYEKMTPAHIVFMDLGGNYTGSYMPSSEWRMHYDIYKSVPEAAAVVHAHPTYCTALSALHRSIPAFHYMVAAAGGKEIHCAEYATFGTQALSDSMLTAFGSRRSALLANHGMICHGPNLDKALWLANETECLAKQFITALATGSPPVVLPDDEMEVMLAKFKTYGKMPADLAHLTPFERRHAVAAPRFAGPLACGCCAPPAEAPA